MALQSQVPLPLALVKKLKFYKQMFKKTDVFI